MILDRDGDVPTLSSAFRWCDYGITCGTVPLYKIGIVLFKERHSKIIVYVDEKLIRLGQDNLQIFCLGFLVRGFALESLPGVVVVTTVG